MAQIFVAFSEKLNFMKVHKNQYYGTKLQQSSQAKPKYVVVYYVFANPQEIYFYLVYTRQFIPNYIYISAGITFRFTKHQ